MKQTPRTAPEAPNVVVVVPRWILVAYSGLAGALVILYLYARVEGFTLPPHIEWAWRVMLVFMPVALIELASRRYCFGESVVRLRRLFRWQEVRLPCSLALLTPTNRTLSVRDAESGKEILLLTAEFSRRGETVSLLKAYYSGLGRSIVVM